MVGLIINFPEILPMRITPTGPPQGISDNIRAADVALTAITSGSCFPSEESTLAITYESCNIKGYTLQAKKIIINEKYITMLLNQPKQ
jgi:hypothetical protein